MNQEKLNHYYVAFMPCDNEPLFHKICNFKEQDTCESHCTPQGNIKYYAKLICL